jgi:hypothetical protein
MDHLVEACEDLPEAHLAAGQRWAAYRSSRHRRAPAAPLHSLRAWTCSRLADMQTGERRTLREDLTERVKRASALPQPRRQCGAVAVQARRPCLGRRPRPAIAQAANMCQRCRWASRSCACWRRSACLRPGARCQRPPCPRPAARWARRLAHAARAASPSGRLTSGPRSHTTAGSLVWCSTLRAARCR